ncbi:unnamed protein product [Chilo suppressalis]|uniref:Protein phosphatase 1 regulatory subunit 35 C-terminal domain-containing protein n=1 Tax=Chilo suppressalis TaxID=168631 RepID=A0ABN8B925_CHISP|nr:unnamed protein product [Chilo suppressalis]
MWQDSYADQSSSERSNRSLQHQKNFNPYEILTPQRSTINEPLIDLGTLDEATCVAANKLTENVWNSTSANKSKGFDAIDLYENILVTPQLVNNQNHMTIENHIDFKEFFNKLESGKKHDWLNINSEPSQQKGAGESSPTTIDKSHNCGNSRDINVLKTEILFDKTEYSAKHDYFFVERTCEYKTTEEDIIEEVLLDKTLEKIKFAELNKPTEVLKVLPTPTIYLSKRSENINKSSNYTIETPKNIVNDNLNDKTINQELVTKKIQKCSSFNDNFPIRDSSSSKDISGTKTHKHVKKDLKKGLFPDFTVTLSQLKSDTNSNILTKFDLSALHILLDEDKIESSEKTLEPINRKFAVRETPISPGRLLENQQKTMPKDAKHFAKYSIDIDFNKQINPLTPGPTFDEKMLVLPSILERLKEQKRAFEYTNNLQRRLILDEGAKRRANMDSTTLKPVVLKEDCNKDRLQSFKVGQMFEKFVKPDYDS